MLALVFFKWDVFKSLVSHSMLTLSGVYLFVGGFVKIRVKNVAYYALGLLFAGALGLLVNLLFLAFGLQMPNAMYLLNPPIAEVPLSAYVIALIMLVLIFVFTALWEHFFVKEKEELWYTKIKRVRKS